MAVAGPDEAAPADATPTDPPTAAVEPAEPVTAPTPSVNGNGSSSLPDDDAEFAVREAQESVSRRRAAVPTLDGPPTAPVPAVTDGEERPRPRRRSPRPETEPGPRRGRRVRRVIRRIDLWSVLKLAIVLYTCLYGAVLGTVALLWGLAYSSGQIDKLESFLADVGLENYRFYGDQMFRAVMAIGAVGVLGATLVTVLTAALVNLVSEITGGIRVIVIEEEPPPRR